MSRDPTSYSRPDLCVVKNNVINWTADFDKHILKGDVTIQFERVTSGELVLDTKGLHIQQITSGEGVDLKFILSQNHAVFGSALSINVPENCTEVKIFYETSSNASALQWLKPEQTSGKNHPYLFSQCQAIHARSIIPCQDTPGVKSTYQANVTVDSPLVALMSAVQAGQENVDGNQIKYKFEQKVPIPSYLLAIVVGKLTSKTIGPRSAVWSEQEFIDKSAAEFVETESFISAAESIVGPYVWGRYDLLVLPPSFPYGGMENPCLTFVTPTLLAGDRSLADVIAHEISHSWTGNLVTNKTWEHFWLNEGHTMFLERKILSKLHGEQTRHFKALHGLKSLQSSVDLFGATHPFTNLVISLDGVDPDDSFSTVPYEKGHTFLFYLETLLGGPGVFDKFLLAYIEKFKYACLTSEEWKNFLYKYFTDLGKKDILDKVDWDTWFNKPGMPPVIPDYDKTLATACHSLAEKWKKSSEGFSSKDLSDFTPYQIIEFLSELLQGDDAISVEKYKKIDELYNISASHNSEIKFLWLQIGIKAKCTDAISPALGMVIEQGRMKFTRPLYRSLGAWDKSREQAIDCFSKHRHEMHSTTAQLVSKDLGITCF